jgi:hypothetical protein
LLEELLGAAPKGLGQGPLLGGGDALEVAVKGVGELNLGFNHDVKMMEMEIWCQIMAQGCGLDPQVEGSI